MKTIVLIGAGQLGSRHLQALSKINFTANIQVVDPSQSSLEVAKTRFEQMPLNQNIKISYFTSTLEINKKIDIAIIATNADVRASAIVNLVEVCEVDNLILEKVLFQKTEDYEIIDKLLIGKNIKAWVNHPFRAYPFYKNLKVLLKESSCISYQVQGGDWGLGCNGLHYIDLLAFLSEHNDLTVLNQRLDRKLKPSKRKGFVEFTGTLSGMLGPHQFDLFCHDQVSPLSAMICSDNLNIQIDESKGWVRMSRKEDGWIWKEENLKLVHYQSELTHVLVTEILETGKCDLPSYQDALKIHLPFISSLIEHLSNVEQKNYSFCPIT